MERFPWNFPAGKSYIIDSGTVYKEMYCREERERERETEREI
jgi:hypothetical protein